MPHDTREVRGIPLWLLQEYAVEVGGRATAKDAVDGDGWSMRLTQIEDFTVGSLRVGQVRMELFGTEAGLKKIQALMEPKLVRAGG